MGVEYVIVLKPVARAPREISEAEIESYYAEHCPDGSPPLAAIREHILHAIQKANEQFSRDPLYDITTHVSGRTTRGVANDIDLLADAHGWPRLHSFLVAHPEKYLPPEDGLALFDPLVERLQAEIRGEVSTRKPTGRGTHLPVKKHVAQWEYALEELIPYRDLLRAAAEQGRWFRLEIFS